MTTNKLDTMLHNIYADHTDGCDPDDCWSTEIVEAYIVESNIKLLEKLKVNPIVVIDINGIRKQLEKPMLYIEDVDNLLNELKSNERS